jgi:hypothetical protein
MQGTRYLSVSSVVFVCLLAAGVSQKDLLSGKSADLPGPAYVNLVEVPKADRWVDPAGQRAALPAPSPAMPGRFELLGHEPLMNRGMNAAIAVHGNYVYVGYRSDGTHLNSGVMVVDASNPKAPKVVHQIGPPEEGNIAESSRELRVLPQQQLLLVLNHGCSELIHRCVNIANSGISLANANIRFYDIAGANAANPKLVATYVPSVETEPQIPHEFFIWSDPQRPGRVLLYETRPSGSGTALFVVDISHARENKFEEIGFWAGEISDPDADVRLHSLTLSGDGRRAYVAYLGGGFIVADTSDFADNKPKPDIRQLTPGEKRVHWGDPGAHSAIQIPGRPQWAMTTDEVYGKLGGVLAGHGCPWGWVRFIDIADPAAPRVASQYRLPSNDPAICGSVGADRDNFSSFSSHNPTLTPHLAFVTWHSAGLQAIDITDPEHPTGAAQYLPDPLPLVDTEDPALSSGTDKVVMWSFPIVQNGLIYAIDIRNGLYILRYHGPHEDEVSQVGFLDGNSNSGDIVRFDTPGATAGATAGPACLAAPLKLGARTLGPFALGQTRAKAMLRAGPATRAKGRTASWCVGKKSKATVVFSKSGRVVLAVVTRPTAKTPASAARVTKNVRRAGSRIYVRRGGKLSAAGVTSLRSRASILSALKAAKLR